MIACNLRAAPARPVICTRDHWWRTLANRLWIICAEIDTARACSQLSVPLLLLEVASARGTWEQFAACPRFRTDAIDCAARVVELVFKLETKQHTGHP